MSEQGNPTAAGRIMAPVRVVLESVDVTLTHLRDTDGHPVVVRVEPVEMFDLMEIMGTLPGYLPPVPGDAGLVNGSGQRGVIAQAWERYRPKAAALIAASCTPRFGAGGLPLDWLTDSEQFTLVSMALSASGWFGGPADAVARFPGLADGAPGGPGGSVRMVGPDEDLGGGGGGDVVPVRGPGGEPVEAVRDAGVVEP